MNHPNELGMHTFKQSYAYVWGEVKEGWEAMLKCMTMIIMLFALPTVWPMIYCAVLGLDFLHGKDSLHNRRKHNDAA